VTPPPAPIAPAPGVQPTTPDAELARLHQQLQTEAGRRAATEQELAELRGRMAQLSEQVARTPAPAPAPAAPPSSLITEEDLKDFGPDLLGVIERSIKQHVGGQVSALVSRLGRLEVLLGQTQQAAQVAQKSAQELAAERYYGELSGLTRHVGDWRATNDDAGFLDWLKNVDTFSSKTLQELLVDAHGRADAKTVSQFFLKYWESKGIAPAAPAPTSAPAQPTPAAPTIDARTLVAPAPAAAPTPNLNPRGGKVWKESEISQIYDDRTRGRITAERFAQLEGEAMQAIAEGRVQLGA
jgi:hypothetical protein